MWSAACLYLPHEGPVAQAHAVAGTPGSQGASKHPAASHSHSFRSCTEANSCIIVSAKVSVASEAAGISVLENWFEQVRVNMFCCMAVAHATLLNRCIVKFLVSKNAGWAGRRLFSWQSLSRYSFKLRVGPPLRKGPKGDAVDWKRRIFAKPCKAKVSCRQPA